MMQAWHGKKAVEFDEQKHFLPNDDLDDDTFRKGSLDDHDKAEFMINFQSQMLQMNDDLHKINKDFAGDTFSQISSTLEYQNKMPNQQQSYNELYKQGHGGAGTNGARNNASKNSQTKLYQYKEKHSLLSRKHDDELCDEDILNNSADAQSPTEQQNPHQNFLNNNLFHQRSQQEGSKINFHQLANVRNQCVSQVKYHQQNFSNQNEQLLMMNNPSISKQYYGGIVQSACGMYPSPHSQNINNIIITNSEHLQQSTSTMTVYNSGFFDEASILRILDKTISDYSDDQDISTGCAAQDYQNHARGNTHKLKKEQSFKYECDDVMAVLGNLNLKLKEKLQKCRINSSSSQITTMTIDELKQLEIYSTSAVEKIRQLSHIGTEIIQSNEYRNVKFKQYKEKLKIKIHKQIQKYKELCRKQYSKAEQKMYKYQINEFEYSQKLKMLEEKIDRQQRDINRQARVCEQVRQQKSAIMGQYDQRINDMEGMLQVIIRKLKDDGSCSMEKQQKVSNSFCIGDHSLLLQPSIFKAKYNMNKPIMQKKQQQSVDDKENESFLSNHIDKESLNLPSGESKKKGIKNELLNMKKIIQEIKKIHQQFAEQQQEGGSIYHDSALNLLSNICKLQGDEQQSIYEKTESSKASVNLNKAFIQSQEANSKMSEEDSSEIEGARNLPGRQQLRQNNFINILQMDQEREENKNNTTIDMQFNQSEILVVDGKRQPLDEEFKELKEYMHLDEKISEKDLNHHEMDIKGMKNMQFEGIPNDMLEESKKLVIGSQRDKLLKQNHYKSIGSPDGLHLNERSIAFMNSQRQENSVEEEMKILHNFGALEQEQEQPLFPGDVSGIDNNGNIHESTGGSIKQNFLANQSLYSGGSSLINLNYAFDQSKNRNKSNQPQDNQLIVIKVKNREIKMPKLNLGIAVYGDEQPYKHNISNIQSQTSQSSSSFGSSMPLAHKSQENIGSFINESLPNKKIDGSANTGTQHNLLKFTGELLESHNNILDQNLEELDNSQEQDNHKNYQSNNNVIKVGAGGHNLENMFGSFKEELSQLDKIHSLRKDCAIIKDDHPHAQQQKHDDTLDLGSSIGELNIDGGGAIEPFPQMQQNFKEINLKMQENKEDDTSIDLSKSIFKKSQSDPNLLFNFKDEKESPDGKDLIKVQFKGIIQSKGASDSVGKEQSQQNKPIFNFNKIKTPQGSSNQIKIKFNRQNSKEQLQDLQQVMAQPERQHQLQALQKKIASNAGNSRQDCKQQNTSEGPASSDQQHQQQIFLSDQQMQIKKVARGMKIKLQPKQQDLTTYIEKQPLNEHNEQSAMLGKISFIQEQNVNQSNIVQINDTVDDQAQSIILNKKRTGQIMNKIVKSQKRRDSALADEQLQYQQPKSEEQQQPLVAQNYFSAAAAINSQNSSKLSKQKRSLAIRKPGIIQPDNANQYSSNPDTQTSSDNNNNNQYLIEQLKQYQESYDMEGMQMNSNRKNQQNPHHLMISPGKQRTSQSCTPQKKSLIVVSRQLIKRPPGMSKNMQAQNDSRASNEGGGANVVATGNEGGPILKRISINKRMNSQQQKQQNMSVINQSVDTSCLHLGGQQNASILITGNPDNSLMIHGDNVNNNPIINKIQGVKIFKKIISKQQHQQQVQQLQQQHEAQPYSSGEGHQPNLSVANVKSSNNIIISAQANKNISNMLQQPTINIINPNILKKIKNQQLKLQNEVAINGNQNEQSSVIISEDRAPFKIEGVMNVNPASSNQDKKIIKQRRKGDKMIVKNNPTSDFIMIDDI